MRTTKAQISLHVRAVWSAPFLFAALDIDSIIPPVSISEIWSLYLASVTHSAQAGFSLPCSQILKTCFLVTRLNWCRFLPPWCSLNHHQRCFPVKTVKNVTVMIKTVEISFCIPYWRWSTQKKVHFAFCFCHLCISSMMHHAPSINPEN